MLTIDQDVSRFDVAMYHALIMRVLQGLADLGDNLQRFFRLHLPGIDDLAQGEFTPSLLRRMKRTYGAPINTTEPLGITPPVFEAMSGRVASISELFLTPDFRQTGALNLRALLLLTFAYARTEWDFDWLYALIGEDHAAQRYLASYCFATTYQTTGLWPVTKKNPADANGIFGSLSREDFQYLVDLVTRRPSLLQFE